MATPNPSLARDRTAAKMIEGDTLPVQTLLNWTPTLLFHEVLPDGTAPLPDYAVTRSQLRNILRDFVGRGYLPGSLEDALGERPRKGKRLVLTFDDGTRDFLDNALPVLDEFGFKATLFIVSGLMGKERAWKTSAGDALVAPVPLMSADEVRELHRRGFTLGSHTVSHKALSGLPDEEVRCELGESKKALEGLTGASVEWFAYPYISLNDRTRQLVKETGYRGACGGYNAAHSRYHLDRIEASVFTLEQLRQRTSPLRFALRALIRKAKGH